MSTQSSLPPGVPKEDVGVKGTIYLLHLDPPYKHAKHYLGWTGKEDVYDRVLQHVAGRGSPLVRAAVQAGSLVVVARTWADSDRFEERRLKGHSSTRYCPICNEEEE